MNKFIQTKKYKNNVVRNKYSLNNETYKKPPTQNSNIYIPSIKHQLVNFIYSNIELNKYNFALIDNKSVLLPLYKNDYYVMPIYFGKKSLLIFNKFGNNYYSYMIERKLLSYNKETININGIIIEPIDVRVNINIYKGTIFDGILMPPVENGNRTFIINDAYMFEGSKQISDMIIEDKLIRLSSWIDVNYKKDNEINTIDLNINSVYKLEEIHDMLIDIPSKTSLQIRGFDFVPSISGTKFIFLYKKINNTETNNEVKTPNIRLLPVNTLDNKYVTFKMKKKTDEVFYLYLRSKKTLNDIVVYKHTKICIAFLPTHETSKLCDELFLKYGIKNVLVDCKLSKNKKYWIPIQYNSEKKHADLIDELG